MWNILELFPDDFLLNILDVGAALSETPSYQSLVEAKRARLIGFEPNIEECNKLQKSYGDPHQFFPFFVADGKQATFYETNWNLTGSLYEPNTELLAKFQRLPELVTLVNTHSVETRTIDSISEIDQVDFFKIDVQGAELIVFENAKRILAGTLVIQTEVEFVELYKNQPLFADVDRFLRSQGFQLHEFCGISGRTFKPLFLANQYAGNQHLWTDAFYVRDWMKLEELSVIQLKKYAILIHEITKSYDLTHLILSVLDQKEGSGFAEHYLNKLINP